MKKEELRKVKWPINGGSEFYFHKWLIRNIGSSTKYETAHALCEKENGEMIVLPEGEIKFLS